MIEGIKVSIGGTEYVIPPMTLRIQLCDPTKASVEKIQQGAESTAEFVDAALDVILACAKRNYPDLERDVLMDLDFADISPLVVSLMTKSGFAPRPLTPPEKVASAPTAPAAPSDPAPVPSPSQPSPS